jgi:RNA polymerase sigma-70 factor, ECF subfamily
MGAKLASAGRERGRRETEPLEMAAVACSFDSVYEDHFPFVWRTLRMLGVRQAALEDAAQDTFSVVARQLGTFDGRAAVKTWIFAIAQRVAANHRRGDRRKLALLEPLGAELIAPQPSQEAEAEAAEAAGLIERYCETLDEERRAVFVLSLIEEVPAAAVAAALGVPVNTVYSRVRALREGLKRFLEREAVDDG